MERPKRNEEVERDKRSKCRHNKKSRSFCSTKDSELYRLTREMDFERVVGGCYRIENKFYRVEVILEGASGVG